MKFTEAKKECTVLYILKVSFLTAYIFILYLNNAAHNFQKRKKFIYYEAFIIVDTIAAINGKIYAKSTDRYLFHSQLTNRISNHNGPNKWAGEAFNNRLVNNLHT